MERPADSCCYDDNNNNNNDRWPEDSLLRIRRTFSHGVGLIAARHLANCWTAFEKNNFSSAIILTIWSPARSAHGHQRSQSTAARFLVGDVDVVRWSVSRSGRTMKPAWSKSHSCDSWFPVCAMSNYATDHVIDCCIYTYKHTDSYLNAICRIHILNYLLAGLGKWISFFLTKLS